MEVLAPKVLDRRAATTYNCRNSAEVCRANGWSAGTRLIGDEGYGPHIIEITAVGRDGLLAMCLNREHGSNYEGNWTLSCRDWHPVDSEAGKWLAEHPTQRPR